MNFVKHLENILPRPCIGQRPFVCDGFPHESTVLIVGENPGQQMSDWWSYWNPATGFDRESFSQHYLATKQQEKGDPSWNYRGTRARFQRLHEMGVRAVETNKFRNEKMDGAGNRQERIVNHDVLGLLLSEMTGLRLVVAHGKVAHNFVDTFAKPGGLLVLNLPHFRSLAYDRLNEIVEKA